MCLFLDRSKATPLSQQFYINGIRHGPDEENVLWSHFILYLKREGAVPQNSEVKQIVSQVPGPGGQHNPCEAVMQSTESGSVFLQFLISSNYHAFSNKRRKRHFPTRKAWVPPKQALCRQWDRGNDRVLCGIGHCARPFRSCIYLTHPHDSTYGLYCFSLYTQEQPGRGRGVSGSRPWDGKCQDLTLIPASGSQP